MGPVSSHDIGFQRARRPEQKLQRQLDILDAARDLALRDGVVNVSLTDIADRAGLHKSALLRYFESREQIFLVLATEAWLDWAQAVRAELDGTPAGAIETVADVIVRTLVERRVLCDVIAQSALYLERNVSLGGLRRYKLASFEVFGEVVATVNRVLPSLTPAECGDFVDGVLIAAGALFQMASPPPVLAEAYGLDPELSVARVDFQARLRRTASILLAGLVNSRNSIQ
jgi:AcrR family transcriptional regulator